VLSWIFIHGTNIVDRSLKVLFFGIFCYFSVFFSLAPPEKFSADALVQLCFIVYSKRTIDYREGHNYERLFVKI